MLRTLPMGLSVIAQDEFRENFRRGGYINRGGVLIRWRKRKVERKKRDNGRGILVRTGKLMRGNRAAPKPMVARVVNSVPYAHVHNEGFQGTVQVKAHTRNLYTRKREGTGIHNIKTQKERLKTITRKSGEAQVKAHSRKVMIPKRPFMKNSPIIDKKIDKHIERELDKIWNKV